MTLWILILLPRVLLSWLKRYKFDGSQSIVHDLKVLWLNFDLVW